MAVASLSAKRIGPYASTGVLVKVQSSGALDFDGFSFNAVVEDVADGGVRVGEETVAARAHLGWLWGLCGKIEKYYCYLHTICVLDYCIYNIE